MLASQNLKPHFLQGSGPRPPLASPSIFLILDRELYFFSIHQGLRESLGSAWTPTVKSLPWKQGGLNPHRKSWAWLEIPAIPEADGPLQFAIQPSSLLSELHARQKPWLKTRWHLKNTRGWSLSYICIPSRTCTHILSTASTSLSSPSVK